MILGEFSAGMCEHGGVVEQRVVALRDGVELREEVLPRSHRLDEACGSFTLVGVDSLGATAAGACTVEAVGGTGNTHADVSGTTDGLYAFTNLKDCISKYMSRMPIR